jgi:integrase
LSSHRSITAPPPLVEILEVHRLQQQFDRSDAGELWQETGHIFTTKIDTPIEPRNLSRTFHNLCDKTEVRRIRFHGLRHTCASLLHAKGVPLPVIASILCHSSTQITDDIYIDIFPTEQHNALNALGFLYS